MRRAACSMKSEADGLLIIGYGNPLRGDDAVGPRVARGLRISGLPAIEARQLTPELAERLSRIELAVFVDADVGLNPGEVNITIVQESDGSGFVHQANPGGLLRLTREIYGHAPAGLLIGIGGESYEFGRPLSQSARRAVNDVIEFLVNSEPTLP